MSFSDFYCDASSGSNSNGGSDAGSPSFTSAIGTWNGTDTYTTASTTGVAVGQFANIGGSYVARVVTVTLNVSITLSTTAKSGTAPGAGVTTCNVGGAWKGPNGATAFPFGFITNVLTNSAGDAYCVNYKNNSTYSITAAISHALPGPGCHRGYTSTIGDGGRAIIDGGTSGASYILLTMTSAATDVEVCDLICQNNGATGSASGVVTAGARCSLYRTVVNSVQGYGLSITAAGVRVTKHESYSCNQSNTANLAGINMGGAGASAVRCIAHDNAGSNGNGFRVGNNVTIDQCISDSNGGAACLIVTGSAVKFAGFDAYNNGYGIKIEITGAVLLTVENSNFIKNGGYGIASVGVGPVFGSIRSCGFGSGTQANTSGQTNGLNSTEIVGSVTYAADVTPWVDPANGDFRISLAAAKGTGDGAFTQTAASYAGAVGFPDIGSNQHVDAGGSGGFVFGG